VEVGDLVIHGGNATVGDTEGVLGEVAAGKAGRAGCEEITLLESLGMAIKEFSAVIRAYCLAQKKDRK
jgi:ornithine cyclodeaminase/alanine dehydrogenase-like protein (mu-crystallin family)